MTTKTKSYLIQRLHEDNIGGEGWYDNGIPLDENGRKEALVWLKQRRKDFRDRKIKVKLRLVVRTTRVIDRVIA